MKLIVWVGLKIVGLMLCLRYRITIKGLENIRSAKGVLILPNHPAEVDPLILMGLFWWKLQPRPLVVEHFFHLKGFGFLVRSSGALPVPELNGFANKWKIVRMEKQLSQIEEGLKRGENFLIYPGGRLKLESEEVIGGASLTHRLLQECPEAQVVLVRTTGLWGSMFSRALTGKVPSFGGMLVKGMKIVLQNGIFFTPRRKVLIEIELLPKDFPKSVSRFECNQRLEQWYNKVPDNLILVPHYFWKKALPVVKTEAAIFGIKEKKPISPAIEKEVIAKVAELAKKPASLEMHLSRDLGLDSLDVAQLYMFLDSRYGLTDVNVAHLQTVEDLAQAAAGAKGEGRVKPKWQKKLQWPAEKKRPPLFIPEGNSLVDVFVKSAKRMRGHIACADGRAGIFTYGKLKLAAFVLAAKIKKMPGKHIGVMLPSSTGSYLTILACMMAGKIPVMLNWTAGARSLNHALKLCHIQTVLTAQAFLDNLATEDVGDVENHFVFLEDVKKEIGLIDKLKAPFFCVPKLLEDDTAAILFTSGTESLPKGVPLSHKNILSNLRGALSCEALGSDQTLYGVLPPFHSFGFSVAGLFPLLSGIKVFYAPDPTDAHGMANDIEQWKITLIFCAPTFLLGLFRAAKKGQLDTLSLIVSGAEKASPELLAFAKDKLVEGYGITECAPVVTLNRPHLPRRGVGQPLPGVEIKIQGGEILIAGPNVFKGYLGDLPSPFVELDGKRWYKSGDRGYLDEDGYLILEGRLKRFIKIGGEMVSLGGLEQEIERLALERKWVIEPPQGPSVAIAVKEGEKPSIILCTVFDIDKEVVNAALQEKGTQDL